MPSTLTTFFAELKRRRVYTVGVTYVAVGLGVLGAAELILEPLGLDGARPFVVILTVLGLPLALVLAWAYEVTPGGLKRDSGPEEEREGRSDGSAVLEPPEAESPASVATTPPSDHRSIAVLPLLNLSGDPDNEYFSDGVTDEILRHLAQIHGLKVISRTSVMRYKRTDKSVREIASELRVGTILEGSVQRAPGRVRVVAQLIDAATDEHLWADTYDRDLEDVFAVQSDIAENIAAALKAKLSEALRRRIHSRPTQSFEAFELALRGRQEFEKATLSALERSVEYFRKALAVDPTYAAAAADMTLAYLLMPFYGDRPTSTYLKPARAAAARAMELDPGLAEAQASDGMVRVFDWDWEGARQALARAVELNPNAAYAHNWAAWCATFCERHEEAVEHSRRAFELDPYAPIIAAGTSHVLLLAGHLEEALAILRPTLEHHPDHPYANVWMGYVLALMGHVDEAAHYLERAVQVWGGGWIPRAIQVAYLQSWGRTEEAARLVDVLRRSSQSGWIEPYAMFSAEVGMGDMAAAFRWLDRAVRERSVALVYLRVVPRFQPLRRDPRFIAVLRTIWPDDPIEVPDGVD